MALCATIAYARVTGSDGTIDGARRKRRVYVSYRVANKAGRRHVQQSSPMYWRRVSAAYAKR